MSGITAPVGLRMAERMRAIDLPVCAVLSGRAVRADLVETTSLRGQRVADALPELTKRSRSMVRLAAAEDGGQNVRPLKLGAVLSGGPAAGGHNVLVGIYQFIKAAHPGSELYGFKKGPEGLLSGKGGWFNDDLISSIKNTGGFDVRGLMGTSRKKLETEEDLANCYKVLLELGLNGVVIIGGDDSNTNAAFLADYFLRMGSDITVIGVPKTIDGDLQIWPWVPISFGFHTATQIYSNLIGNLLNDAKSSLKYWNFVKVMGRSASWIALEAALQTHPNLVLIGEEIKTKKQTLESVVQEIVEVIVARSQAGKNYGLVIIPEGIVEFIPEMNELLKKIGSHIFDFGVEEFKHLTPKEKSEEIVGYLEGSEEATWNSLPENIRDGLLAGPDDHGNIKLSQIQSDVMLMEMCKTKIQRINRDRKAAGQKEVKFDPMNNFYGYEGRCGYPTAFDLIYTYNLGRAAAALSYLGYTGYMAAVSNLEAPVEQWEAFGIPLAGLINVEIRKNQPALVIEKALVGMDNPALLHLNSLRESWKLGDDYLNPGTIQYLIENGQLAIDNLPLIMQIMAQAYRQN